MAKARANAACMIYGDSGTGKSSLIATLAEKVYGDHGKKTLYYLVDGGGYGSQLEALIEAGIVWVWKLRTRGEAFETCAMASRGHWPVEWDPETGECAPGSKLLAPVTTEYKLYCPCGELVNTQPFKSAMKTRKVMCKCKTLVAIDTPNARVEEIIKRTAGLEDVGAVAFDGITSMQQWIMSDLAELTASGKLKGEATGLGGNVVSGEYTAGGNNRAHYAFSQNHAEKWILDSTAIPSLVAPPIWTALAERGSTPDTRVAVYGPKLAGGAKTAVAPQWVGNCISLEVYQDKHGRNVHRMHLQEWKDPVDGTPHLAKNRALPGHLPPYLEDTYDEDGKVEYFKNFSLATFFELLDNALERARMSTEKRFANAPGLPKGKIGGVASETVENFSVTPETPKPSIAKPLPKAKPGVRGAISK